MPAQVALLAGLLTACSASAGEEKGNDAAAKASASASEKAGAAAGVAASGGSLGASGSACELPVTFDIAESWKAKAVEADTGDAASEELAELADALLHQGPFTMVCEIDAKPAGNIGFIRVWTGKATDEDAESLLREFVAEEGDTSEAEYSGFTPASAPKGSGAEVEYLSTSKALDESKKERAFAVTTPEGPVLVHLGGFDSQEHQEMLPAYALAKQTLRIS